VSAKHLEAIANAEFLRQANKEQKEAKSTLAERVLARAMANLVLSITNVHINYQHPGKNGLLFSAGFTLRELKIVTTDSNGNAAIPASADPTQCVHKLAQISDMSFYWNTCGNSWLDLTDKGYLQIIFPCSEFSSM